MKKKIIITERQMGLIVKLLKENSVHDRILGRMVEDLDLNYEPAMGTHEIGNEFYNTPLISKKVTGDTITPKDLFEYLDHKFQGLNKEFIKQVITDWYHGRLSEGGGLSKNVGVR